MSKQMLELADLIESDQIDLDNIGTHNRNLIVSALRCSAVSAHMTVSDAYWQRALDCAVSCMSAVSRSELDNAMQHAFGMLSLSVRNEPQAALSCDQCQEPMGGPHHPECYRFTEPQTVASPADEMRRTAATACKNCRHRGSHLAWRCDACGFEVEHSQAVSAEESGK